MTWIGDTFKARSRMAVDVQHAARKMGRGRCPCGCGKKISQMSKKHQAQLIARKIGGKYD